jgi:hypothetical protein
VFSTSWITYVSAALVRCRVPLLEELFPIPGWRASWLTRVGDIFFGLKLPEYPVKPLFTITIMSLLPVAVVVVASACFFLFRMLGGKTEKVAQPQLPQTSQPPQRRDSSESGSKPVPLDGFASFHFVEGNPFAKQTPSTPPRRHPCRVCGIPSIRRCIHCKSAYYCSREHCIQACFRSLSWTRHLIL